MMAMSAEPGRKTAYSADLRWRVVWQRIGMGLTFRKIAENLNIACSTAQATYKLFEQTGGVDPRGQPSRTDVRSLNDTDEIYIVGLVLENPSMYISTRNMPGGLQCFRQASLIPYYMPSAWKAWIYQKEDSTGTLINKTSNCSYMHLTSIVHVVSSSETS